MSVEILPVRTRKQLRAFLRLPWRLYRGDPHWVAPLLLDEGKRFDPRRNPFFEHAEVQLFLAVQDGKPAGRICAHIDRIHNEFHREKTAFFGFFESVKSEEVARALLETAENWAKERGMERLRGPFGFNTNGFAGLLVEGFHSPPTLLMPYNPPYYASFLEGCGYRKAKDLLAFRIEIDKELHDRLRALLPRLEKIAERAREKGFRVRSLNLRDFHGEVRRLREIYNEAWERNWGFVPLTEREFTEQAKELKQIVRPELAKIVELDGEPVGFGLAVPDFNEALKPVRGRLLPFGIFRLLWASRKIQGLRLLTLGIKRRHRVRGVDALIYCELIREGLKLPYRSCECSWILEDNHRIIRAIELAGGRPYKTYRVYEKDL